MTCEVQIIEDSINPYNGIRLTTFQLKYWRSIHSEVMTHRVLSKSASSSRAVPLKKTLKNIWNDPAGPSFWGSNNPGMQSNSELEGWEKTFMEYTWNGTGRLMCGIAWCVDKIANPHKQIINRILEPWSYINVVMTGTEWDNFYELRTHKDAQPEFQELAKKMKSTWEKNEPTERLMHLPYITLPEREILTPEEAFKVSTARCARVSYLLHNKKNPSKDDDIALYEKLVGSKPIHASPSEHCAWAIDYTGFIKNFRGWEQHRVTVEENLN